MKQTRKIIVLKVIKGKLIILFAPLVIRYFKVLGLQPKISKQLMLLNQRNRNNNKSISREKIGKNLPKKMRLTPEMSIILTKVKSKERMLTQSPRLMPLDSTSLGMLPSRRSRWALLGYQSRSKLLTSLFSHLY